VKLFRTSAFTGKFHLRAVLLLSLAAAIFLPVRPVAAAAAGITYTGHILTINLTSDYEILQLSTSGANLVVTSNSGTTADPGAQDLGFSATTAPDIANTGSLTGGGGVMEIVVNGAEGRQSVRINGGAFPGMTIGPGGDIENTSFQTSGSEFQANLDVTANELLAVNVPVISSNLAPITFSADSMTLAATIGDLTWQTPVNLRQASSTARDIDLGGSSSGTLALTNTEINQVYAGLLRIGRLDNTGNIRLSAPVASPLTRHIELYSGGGIQDHNNTGTDLTVRSLGMAASTGIGVGGVFPTIEVNVTYLEAHTITGGIQVQQSTGPLTIGQVSSTLTGLDVIESGDIQVSTVDGSLYLADEDGQQTVSGGNDSSSIVLTANGLSSDLTSTADHDAVAAPGGSITLSAGRDIRFGTGGPFFDNDTQASGSLTLSAGRDITLDGFTDVVSDAYGKNTGGSVYGGAGRNISISNNTGDTASLGASGTVGAGVEMVTGPNGVLLISSQPDSLYSSSGDVMVSADRLVLASGSAISAGSHVVTIQPRSNNWTVNLGSTTDAALSTLELSDAELDRVTAGVLRIGDLTNTLALQITASITAPGCYTLSLFSRGAITDSTPGEQADLTVSNLALRSSSGIGASGPADLDIHVSNLAFTGDQTGVVIANTGPLAVSSVDGLASSSNTGGLVYLTAEGPLAFNASTYAAGILTGIANETAAPTDHLQVGPGITVRGIGGIALVAGDRIILQPGSAVRSESSFANLLFGFSDSDEVRGAEIRGLIQASTLTLQGSAYDDTVMIDFYTGEVQASDVSYYGGEGSDSLVINDSVAVIPHTYILTGASVTRDAGPEIILDSVAGVTINGGTASDTFTVTPSAEVAFNLSGGQPNLPTLPGDRLDVEFDEALSPSLNITSLVDGYAGSWSFDSLLQVDFSQVELLNPTPSLSLTNTDWMTTALQGTSTTYTITATNNSPFAVNGVRLSNPLPDGAVSATYTSTAAGGAAGNTASGTGAIDDILSMPHDSSVTYYFKVDIDPLAHGWLENIATLIGPGGLSAADDPDRLAPLVDLAITNTDGVIGVRPGLALAYTIVVTNSGPDTADGAVVSVPLDAGITGVTYTSNASGGATGSTSGSGAIHDTLVLPPGSSVTYWVTATVDPEAAGTFINTATVTAPAGTIDVDLTNNSSSDSDTVEPYYVCLPLVMR